MINQSIILFWKTATAAIIIVFAGLIITNALKLWRQRQKNATEGTEK